MGGIFRGNGGPEMGGSLGTLLVDRLFSSIVDMHLFSSLVDRHFCDLWSSDQLSDHSRLTNMVVFRHKFCTSGRKWSFFRYKLVTFFNFTKNFAPLSYNFSRGLLWHIKVPSFKKFRLRRAI